MSFNSQHGRSAHRCRMQVFPGLYLPVMAEGHKRSLRPWRMYLPTPSWFQYRRRMAALNAYVKGRLRERWAERQKISRSDKEDIADLLMASIEVSTVHCPLHPHES